MRSLLIDAGNTTVKIATHEKGNLKLLFRIPTRQVLKFPEKFTEKLNGITYDRLGLVSVVKEITEMMKNQFPEAMIVSTLTKLPIQIDYRTPELLGADRIAAACGGLEFADSFIVISSGTATVVDIVENRTFRGGIIFPGLETMAKSLKMRTSQLPEVKPEAEVELPGKSPEECIKGGILLSTIGGIKEITCRYPNYPVLITGGWGTLISKHIKGQYISELTLIGLLKILQEQ
jgi:type III pantothenate kinase